MRFLKILLIILAVLTAVIAIGAEFLPNTYTVSRSTTIKASDSVVYQNVVNFHNFLKWNPWSRMEPTAVVKISGDIGNPGHLYEWAGTELGIGHMQLQEVKPYSDAEILLTFEEPFESDAQNHFTFEKVRGGTRVTWSMKDQSDAILDKWMYLTMDNMMGKDFESGLKNLKEMSEH